MASDALVGCQHRCDQEVPSHGQLVQTAVQSAALRAAWGAYPASPETLELAGLRRGDQRVPRPRGPAAAPAVASERTADEEEQGPPAREEEQQAPLMVEEEREAPALCEEAAAEETGVVALSEGAAAEETGVVVDWALLRTREILTNESLRDRVKRWCCGDHEGLPHISTWNTSRVTDMSCLFFKQRKFNDDIGRVVYIARVTTMKWMFAHASSFNQPLNDWRVDKVTDTDERDVRQRLVVQPAADDWRVENVTDMRGCSRDASAFNQTAERLAGRQRHEYARDVPRRRLVVQPAAERLAGRQRHGYELNDWRVR